MKFETEPLLKLAEHLETVEKEVRKNASNYGAVGVNAATTQSIIGTYGAAIIERLDAILEAIKEDAIESRQLIVTVEEAEEAIRAGHMVWVVKDSAEPNRDEP